jgi:bifunctional non-homologous end joining protein LigD
VFVVSYATGEIGPDLFWQTCLMGLEGLLSKHRDRPYPG